MTSRRHRIRALTTSALTTGALATSACALTGYDFSDYQAVAVQAAGAPAGGEPPAAVGNVEPIPTTFGIGGEPNLGSVGGANGAGSEGIGVAGAGGASTANDGGAACEPQPCPDLGIECGLADNGCGAPQNCGDCFWWFQECRQNVCEIAQ